MADNKINIKNREAGEGACETILSIAQKVTAEKGSITSSFSPLTGMDPDMGSAFIAEIEASLDDISKFLEKINKAGKEYFAKENTNTDSGTDKNKNNNNNYRRSNNNNSNSNSQTTTPETTPSTEPDSTITAEQIDISSLSKIELTDLYALTMVFVELASQKNTTLNGFFDTDVNDDLIKQTLLESPYVPQAFKDQIKDASSKVVKEVLYNILKGKDPEVFAITDLNKRAFKTYLADIASRNGITLDELLNDSKNASLLKNTMSSLSDVIKLIKGWEKQDATVFQEQVKALCNGDVSTEVPNQDIYATRDFVTALAAECNEEIDDLIEDSSYAPNIKQCAVEFGKALTFFNSSSFFSDDLIASSLKGSLGSTKVLVANNDEGGSAA